MDENKDRVSPVPEDGAPRGSSNDDIDEVIKIFHKTPSSPKEQQAEDVTAPESSAPAAPTKPVHAPIPTEATKVNFDPVKPVSPRKQPAHPAPENSKPQTSAAVSLDDFNAGDITSSDSKKRRKAAQSKAHVSFLGSVPFGVVKIIVYIAFVAFSCYFLTSTIIKVGNDVFAFVKEDPDGFPVAELREDMNVTITLPEGATTADVAKILEQADVIEYPWVFEKFAEFRIARRSYLTGKYLAGEVVVNPMMNYDTLIDTLSAYERSQKGTVRITVPEGLTVNETIDLLVQNGVGKKEDYTEALQSFEYEYRFCKELTEDKLSPYRFDTDYSYRLEGYLFPDTYDFYLNENPVSALDKFLVNFNRKFEEEFYDRAAELGMTVDEVITLASMIEKEGNNAEDYYIISSVFHNRLNNRANFPYLNSDAALQYALSERTGLYNLDTTIEHPYNTYKVKGLPPGPICNPGTEAIYAALYPVKTSYYYFYTKKNGETVYARTYEEHQRYINADKASAE